MKLSTPIYCFSFFLLLAGCSQGKDEKKEVGNGAAVKERNQGIDTEDVLALDSVVQEGDVSGFFSDRSRVEMFPSLLEDEWKVEALNEGELTLVKQMNEEEGLCMYFVVRPEMRGKDSIPPSEVKGCFAVSISRLEQEAPSVKKGGTSGNVGN